jgi:hypothetical protein
MVTARDSLIGARPDQQVARDQAFFIVCRHRSQRSGCSQFGRRGIIVDDGQETTTALVVTAVPDMVALAPPATQSLR